jgi:hypothetical protein
VPIYYGEYNVSVEISFISQIVKIKRRVVIQAIHRILLNASLIFLSISTFFFILTKAGLTDYNITGTWYFVPIGICLSAALLIGFVTRSNLLDVLIDIDRRLKLQDRLSTAYEYLKFKKKTEFADLLLNDAAAKLRQINNQQLVPARFSLLHLLVIILLIINIFLYSSVFFTSDFKSTHQELQMIENAGKLLKNYTIGRIDHKALQQSKPQSVYSKKLAKLSNKLRDSSKPFEERFAALDSFLKEVQGEQTRLANDFGARLDSAGIKELPIQKISDLANLSSSQLEKLKGLLSRTLINRIPDSISQNIESLQQLDNIERLLSRIIDDLKDGRSFTEKSAGSAANERWTSQSTEMFGNPPDDPNRPNPDDQFSDHSRSVADRIDQPGSGKLPKNGDDLQDGMVQPEGYSASAGRAQSKEENKSSYELEKTPGAAMQDKMASSQTKSYLIHIRALTDIGKARLKEEDIVQTYRKEVESILKKEDIPINYRDYIKNYFISIGINTEENAHEFK